MLGGRRARQKTHDLGRRRHQTPGATGSAAARYHHPGLELRGPRFVRGPLPPAPRAWPFLLCLSGNERLVLDRGPRLQHAGEPSRRRGAGAEVWRLRIPYHGLGRYGPLAGAGGRLPRVRVWRCPGLEPRGKQGRGHRGVFGYLRLRGRGQAYGNDGAGFGRLLPVRRTVHSERHPYLRPPCLDRLVR